MAIMGGVAAVAVVSVPGCEYVDEPPKPDEIWEGKITIKKGVSVRTEPRIPESQQEAPNNNGSQYRE